MFGPVLEKTSPRARNRGVVAAVLLVVALAATGGVRAGERPAKGREIRADLIYHNYCSVCHGDRGDGRSRARNSLVPPPRDFTSAKAYEEMLESHEKLQAKGSGHHHASAHVHSIREHMLAIVANGKPGTAMTAWRTQLSKQEIEAVVDFVIATFMKRDGSQAAAPVPEGISGTSAHGGRARDAASTSAAVRRSASIQPPR